MKRKIAILMGALIFVPLISAAQDALPPNPVPGKCYVKCITKDTFKEVEETIEISPAYKKLSIVPATYKTVEERVLEKEASKKLIYVPAVYETVEVPYVSKEGRNDLVIVPATFGKDVVTTEVYPVTSGWEYTTLADCPSVNKEDCIVACYVEYPPRSESVRITTLAKDASSSQKPIPEITATYTKQVVKTPARMEEVEIPAVYKVIKKRVIATPARVEEVTIPAKYKTIVRTVLDQKGGMAVWEEVDCGLVGSANVLPILYDYNSAVITPASKKIINNNLLKLMKEKPNLNVEIMSHTDSRGDDAYNMALSQQRAQAVVNYLVANGIERNRLTAKGYGETQLKNKCLNGVPCSAAQHQVNRRTEFRILNQ